jgi:GPH family glycoside/pentoside/hexuronide:cation symporter
MIKFGLAFAGLASGLILSFIGFDNSVAAQSEETLTQLRFAFIGIPIAGTLTAIFVMRNYDLDEKKATEIRDELNLRTEAAS